MTDRPDRPSLRLSRETVRELGHTDLAEAAGGVSRLCTLNLQCVTWHCTTGCTPPP